MSWRSLAVVVLACGGAAGGAAGNGGNGGGAGSGSSGSGGSTGSLDGAWRPASVHYKTISLAPPYAMTDDTLPVSGPVSDPILGVNLEIVQQIAGNTRVTYTRAEGQDVYARQTQSILSAGDESIVSDDGQLLSLKEGKLVTSHLENVVNADGTMSILNWDVTFEPVSGPVPPAGWPSQVVDVPISEP